jgi:thiamine biosynthesis protein ThiI
MKYIIKFFPEMIVKSKSVRLHMSRVLQRNIRNVLTRHSITVKVQDCWDKLVVRLDEENTPSQIDPKEIANYLVNIPGIQSILEVE